MFCPRCRGEYRPGFSTCADCEVPLVESLEEEPHRDGGDADLRLVTVLEEGDSGLLAMAKSLLTAEQIPYITKAEHLQELWGHLGGFSAMARPVVIQVPEEHAERAAEILRDFGSLRGEE